MDRAQVEEAAGNWLIVLGAALLFGSLFLAWSHQLTPMVLSLFGANPTLQGVPPDPTAWQVYSAADVLLAALSVALVAVAVLGSHAARQIAAAASVVALAFVIHALSVPPTNGVDVFNTINNVPHQAPGSAAAGPGETLALIGLVLALVGLVASFFADRVPRPAPEPPRPEPLASA